MRVEAHHAAVKGRNGTESEREGGKRQEARDKNQHVSRLSTEQPWQCGRAQNCYLAGLR